MTGISTSIAIQDRVTGSLNRITAALYNSTSAFNAVDRASNVAFNPEGVQAMTNEMYHYNARIEQLEADLVDANRRLIEMENQTKNAEKAANMLKTAFGMVGTVLGAIGIGKILETSDSIVQTTSRLNMMNDGMQTTDELVNMVYRAAQNARGSFDGMADVVARFGNNAKDAFSSNEEVIAFAELVQKQMTIAGASTNEAANAMIQLSQGLGSGALRGDELNSIFEQAPNLIQNIADYLDVPIGEIRNMASEGKLTADIVKNAIFDAANGPGGINETFENMPMTWGQVWQKMQNTALMSFRPVLNKINELANSAKFQKLVNNVTGAMARVATIVMKIFDLVASVGNYIADNWSKIQPIVMGIVGALGLYYGAMLLYNTITAISTAISTAKAFAESVHAASLALSTGATFAATAAQYGFNAALLACPLTWILLIIVAIIAAIYGIVAAINKLTGSTVSGTGVIFAAFAVLGAHILNGFLVPLQHRIAMFINFFGNVFNNPVAAIKVLFFDMVLSVLGYIQNLVEGLETALNKIPGVAIDVSTDVGNFIKDIEKAQQAVKDESGYVTYAEKMDYIDYEGAWDAGYNLGDGVENTLSSFMDGSAFNMDDAYTDAGVGSMYDATNTIADNTGEALDISNENLQYLRDIAETEAINRFTTAEIKIDMKNNNTINSNMDLDGIVEHLTIGVQEAMSSAAEGVYA